MIGSDQRVPEWNTQTNQEWFHNVSFFQSEDPVLCLTFLVPKPWYKGYTVFIRFSEIQKAEPDLAGLILQMIPFAPENCPFDLVCGRYKRAELAHYDMSLDYHQNQQRPGYHIMSTQAGTNNLPALTSLDLPQTIQFKFTVYLD